MHHWKVPRWATWLCPLVPSLGPFQMSYVYLTCRYLTKAAHRWYGGGGTSSSPAESSSVPRKVQSRSLRSTWASFTSEVRLSADVDAEGVERGKVASFVPWCEPGGVLFKTWIGTWRAQIRVAGNLNLSIKPRTGQIKMFFVNSLRANKQSKTTGHVLYEFLRLHIDRTVLPESSTASVLTPWQADLTAFEFSQTIICPHAVPLAQSSHLLIFLFRKQFFLFFPWGQFLIISSL